MIQTCKRQKVFDTNKSFKDPWDVRELGKEESEVF